MISEKIQKFYRKIEKAGEHHRYRSWEHCYRYFQGRSPVEIAADKDHAALQLGFFLASWGMYRGSSFLLQNAYTVHLKVIDELVAQPRILWKREFGAEAEDIRLVPNIRNAITAIRNAYSPSGTASDTLVTKVILGTFGCLPAYDAYFKAGLKSSGLKHSSLTDAAIKQILDFCQANLHDLRAEQERIKRLGGGRYPLMKLVDMYFWQLGNEAGGGNNGT